MAISWWVDIENSSGVRQGEGPVLPTRWRSTAVLDRAGSFEFEVPATDTRAADLLQLKRIARCKAIIGGTTREVGAGIIESITVRVSNGIPMRVVSGPDLLGELGRTLVDKRVLSSMVSYYYLPTFVNDDEIPYKLLADYANAKTPSAWALLDAAGSTVSSGTAVTDSEVYARFRDDTVLNALIRVAEVTGEHFRIGSGRQVQWLGREADFGASGVRAVYDADGIAVEARSNLAQIASINHVEDVQGMVNRVFVYGNGQGDNRLTMQAATEWPDGTAISGSPHFRTVGGRDYYLVRSSTSSAVDNSFNVLEDATSSAAYGVHEAALQINNIGPLSNTDADVEAAANQLVRGAWEYLLTNAEPRNTYDVRLAGCTAILRPGTTIPVHARRWVDGARPIDIAETLNILSATHELSAAGLYTSGLVVSDGTRQPQTGGDVIAAQAAKSYVMSAHPQIGPNVDTLSYQDEFDSTKAATLNFWLGSEVAQVQRIVLRFTVEPLRSTVKTIAGSASVNVSVPGHVHTIPVGAGTTGTAVKIIDVGGTWYFVADTGLTRYVDTQTGTGSTTGTVDLSSAITTTYGIYEDTGSTITNPKTQCTFAINGNTINASDIDTTAVSGWYEIDLTDLAVTGYDLIDGDTLRPVQVANTVTVVAASGKLGRITAQLQIRASIQSIAYSS